MDTALATIQQGSSPPSIEADAGSWTQEDEQGQYLPVDRLATMYRDYLNTKVLEIEEQKLSRHYFHGVQYTAEDLRILRARRQPIVTYNRTGRKIAQIAGLVQRVRQDPKAYPNKPKGDEGAEIANMAIRATLDASDWQTLEFDCILQAGIDGIAGCEMRLVEGDKGDPDIELHQVYGDEFFYDPVSNKANFSDARYLGIAKWLDADEVIDELFQDKADEINGLVENGSDLTTYADREFKWVLTRQRRIRLVEIWYKWRKKWRWAFFVGRVLLEQGTSPFYDPKNRSAHRFKMFSCAVDHDSDRYGFVRNLKGPQDEINQRRSKGIFRSNSRRLILEKGAVDDVETARREWARPDGIIEVNPSKNVKPDDTAQELAAEMEWLKEAKDEIELFAAPNAMAMSKDVAPNLSGRAVNLLQAPGLAEIGPFVKAVRAWKLDVYRGIWCAQQRLWTSERWIRVTDDQKLAQFLQVNAMEVDEWGRPTMVNYLGALDVDIRIDEGPDEATVLTDTFDILSRMQGVPPAALIELAPIPQSKKERVLQMLQPPPPDPLDQASKATIVDGMKAENDKTRAQVIESHTKSIMNLATAAMNATKGAMSGPAVYGQGEGFAPINGPSVANEPAAGGVPPGAPGATMPQPMAPAGPGGAPPAGPASPDPRMAAALMAQLAQGGPMPAGQ